MRQYFYWIKQFITYLTVTTNLENMENLENSGNLKNCQNLMENSGKVAGYFCRKAWITQGKCKVFDMMANENVFP